MFFTENNDLPVRGQGATLWGYWRVVADPMARLASIPKANTVRYDTLKGPLPTYVNNDLASGRWCTTEFMLLLWVSIFYFIILFFCLCWSSNKQDETLTGQTPHISYCKFKTLSASVLFRTLISMQWNTFICTVIFLILWLKAALWAHSWYSTS